MNKFYYLEDMTQEDLNNLALERNTLQQENQQLKERITYLENSNNRREETIISLRNEQQLDLYKEVIEEVRKKCKEPKKEMDYTVWVKLRHFSRTLEEFIERDIDACFHPMVTSAYKSQIKNSIKELCETIKYKLIFKEDIKDILDKVKGE